MSAKHADHQERRREGSLTAPDDSTVPGKDQEKLIEAYLSESDDSFRYEVKSDTDDSETGEIANDEEIKALLKQSKRDQAEPVRKVVNREDHSPVQQQVNLDTVSFICSFLVDLDFKNTLLAFHNDWQDFEKQYPELQQATHVNRPAAIVKEESSVSSSIIRSNEFIRQLKCLKDDFAEKERFFERLKASFDKLVKQRNVHRMHHRRVVQEKELLIKDITRLKKHCESYEPGFAKLKQKYELMLKEKTLMRIDRDKLASKVALLKQQLEKTKHRENVNITNSIGMLSPRSNRSEKNAGRQDKWSCLTHVSSFKELREHSAKKMSAKNWQSFVFSHKSSRSGFSFKARKTVSKAAADGIQQSQAKAQSPADFESSIVVPENMTLMHTYEGHEATINCLGYHPLKDIIVTGSDDHSVKIWTIPEGELVMVLANCHDSWISAVKFHPAPKKCFTTLLGTAAGDGAVKIWDLKSCTETTAFGSSTSEAMLMSASTGNKRHGEPIEVLKGHTAPVWDFDWCPFGTKLVTASMDHILKLYDCITFKQRVTFRGHKDSVNSCKFFDHNDNLIMSGSADKSVSVWDARTGGCEITLLGHQNAVQDTVCSPTAPHLLASCDLGGEVLLWDVRKIQQISKLNTAFQKRNQAPSALTALAFDTQGKVLTAACADGSLKMFRDQGEAASPSFVKDCELIAHNKTVNSVMFSRSNQYLVSAGADHTFRVWRHSNRNRNSNSNPVEEVMQT